MTIDTITDYCQYHNLQGIKNTINQELTIVKSAVNFYFTTNTITPLLTIHSMMIGIITHDQKPQAKLGVFSFWAIRQLVILDSA